MVAAVELAMGIVQLTAVLIPLLLGLTRYYLNQEMDANISDSRVLTYITCLFVGLFIAYSNAYLIISAYGNPRLTGAVVAYGAILTLLFAAIPYTLDEERAACGYILVGVSFLLVSILIFIGILP